MSDRILPAYIAAAETGHLEKAARAAGDLLNACTLCPRQCRANRHNGERGICGAGMLAEVAAVNAHHGEEAPLSGRHGSGTIFFSHCNLRCVFCQNFDISHQGRGREVTARELAQMMLALQQAGCHNINLVTPTHVAAQILEALRLAVPMGLCIPLVYNSSGYERLETLALLEGIVDIYMPDFKFWRPETARRLCNAPDYPACAREAIREMHRQVGDLATDAGGLAYRGLLIRHLVLPGGLGDTRRIMDFIAREISPDSYVNIMSQYHPCGEASGFPPMDERPTPEEYDHAVAAAKKAGITRLDRPVRRVALW